MGTYGRVLNTRVLADLNWTLCWGKGGKLPFSFTRAVCIIAFGCHGGTLRRDNQLLARGAATSASHD